MSYFTYTFLRVREISLSIWSVAIFSHSNCLNFGVEGASNRGKQKPAYVLLFDFLD